MASEGWRQASYAQVLRLAHWCPSKYGQCLCVALVQGTEPVLLDTVAGKGQR